VSQDEGYLIYKGQVIVHNYEWIEEITEWRFIQSVLRIKIRFQRFISVHIESNLTLFASFNFNAHITRQIVSLTQGSPALVEIVTILQYPYKLSNGSLTLYPSTKIQSSNTNFEDCSGYQNNTCKQRWRISLHLAPDTCTLDGDYKMEWKRMCDSSLTDAMCPISNNNLTASANFKLKSEDFCAEIRVDVGLIGSLASYEDSQFLLTRNSWTVGRRAYFLVKANSDLNSEPYNDATAHIKFSKTDLITVSIRSNKTGSIPIRLLENGNPVTYEPSEDPFAQVQKIPQTAGNTVGFSFVFTPQIVTLLSSKNIIIGAEVLVTYEDSSQKRILLESGNDRIFYATSVSVKDQEDDKSSTIARTNNAYIAFVNMFLLLLVLMY